jgi:hypothetical protein
VLLAGAAIAIVIAVLLAVSGGVRVTVGGLRVSARSPLVPSLVAVALVAAWVWVASRAGQATRDLAAAWFALDRIAWTLVVCIAAASAGAAIAFGTYSAAGADASGYLSQAAMWTSGRLRVADPLSILPGWPIDAGTSAPLGWKAATERGWQVPTYGPGLPMLMAIPYALGGSIAAALTVAMSTAIAVFAVGSIAFHLAGASAAIIAATALASTPVFLYQSLQPMSDVPVTAAWMACWWLLVGSPPFAHATKAFGHVGVSRIWFAGIACAVAVLIRPNLAPLAMVPFIAVFALRTAHSEKRIAAALAFASPVLLAGVFLAWLQWHMYGSPFKSGYGTVDQLYSATNIGPNASLYVGWSVTTSPVLLLALAGVWIKRGSIVWWLTTFAVLNVAAYLAYFVFEDWSYLRFLLPALAIAAVFAGVTVATLLEHVDVAARAVLLLAAIVVIGGLGLWRARALDVFRLPDAHRRVLQIDRYLDAALPPRAAILAGEQSGAVRLDTHRPIVRWEALSADDLARALTALDVDKRPLWILLDAWEESLVRAKFPAIAAAALDWPPAVDAGDTHRTRAWSLADRGRYLKGERVVTDRLR